MNSSRCSSDRSDRISRSILAGDSDLIYSKKELSEKRSISTCLAWSIPIHSQPPAGSSLLSLTVKSLSTKADEKSCLRPASSSVTLLGMANRVPRPSSRFVTVGKKNGACSGALGASFGLFRT
jgi:hypothetical protein